MGAAPFQCSGRFDAVEIKIGVRDIGRELTIETEQSAEQIEQNLRSALASDDGILVVEATKGRRVMLPAEQIGYIDMGSELARPVGFGFGEDSVDSN